MSKNDPLGNRPCPCGSGKTFGQCCGSHLSPFEHWSQIRRQGDAGGEFCGLSPEQMMQLLHQPYESDHFVTFCDHVEECSQAPIMQLFQLIIDAIGEDGLRHTTTGNLPQRFSREAALAFWGEIGYRANTLFAGINSERDFPELYLCRRVAEESGLIRKHKKRFVLTSLCRSKLDSSGLDELYPRMLQAFATEIMWRSTLQHDLYIVQQAFGFTLYLLSRFGGTPRPVRFYQDAFMAAFPLLREQKPEFRDWELLVRDCYARDSLIDFAHMFGLLEFKPGQPEFARRLVKRRDLLNRCVIFHGGYGPGPSSIA